MSGKAKILIVEDETSVAMMMAYLLDHAGCDTQTTGNAEKALRLVQGGNFDLVTLDIDLPGIGGFEICSRLKQNSRLQNIPIVFVSGRPCAENRQHALELGAVDYIEKPFEVTDFIFRIFSHAKVKNDCNTTPASQGAGT